ncbi:MAG: polyprenyl diphosphate synthase [Neisseriaceae bacterium]|nr:polyprenyl diphosphate synthase [Neisseriaceae bacterium]
MKKASSMDETIAVPSHIAIIMDGNGRWAKRKIMPRVMGHKKGLEVLENTVKDCIDLGVKNLTVFAFSTENWKRPKIEVDFLMNLFLRSLEYKIQQLHKNNIRFRFIGKTDRFSDEIVAKIRKGEDLTKNNTLFTITVAADYGGRWDIVNAVNHLIQNGYQEITENDIQSHLALHDLPEPELYIRTGGEIRISNFLLWQMAYTDFYFTDTIWPDFNKEQLILALESFQNRERRFGRTSEQLPIHERRE